MKAKYTVWVAFFLNLSYAIVEFIAGGIFGSSAVLVFWLKEISAGLS